MPEGPEIRRAAERVARAIARRKAEEVFFGQPRLERYAPELTGRMVRSVEARGKAMLIAFSGRWHVYSHNQLYGRWFVREARDFPTTGRSLRFAVHNASASALLYSASEIEVLRGAQLERHPYLSRLGPDPLDPASAPPMVAERVASERFVRRSLATLLLDQGFLAGIGNYLRSEILFFAGLHPSRRPTDLGSDQVAALATAALEVPRRSYATRGITSRADWVERLKRSGEPRRRYRHAVFGRDGRPCLRCATPVERTVAAGRRIYLCPACQPDG